MTNDDYDDYGDKDEDDEEEEDEMESDINDDEDIDDLRYWGIGKEHNYSSLSNTFSHTFLTYFLTQQCCLFLITITIAT